MKKIIFILVILAVLGILYYTKSLHSNNPATQTTEDSTSAEQEKQKHDITPPIDNAESRITKKPFGIHVSPGNSPVNPERFSGYHTAVDFEAPEETDTKIYAVCTGKILRKETARGYGGMVVQACTYKDQPITIIYGHIRLSSMTAKIGDTLNQGDQFVVLGTAYSDETGGERKHLHLGIHKTATVDTRGYVANQSELTNWYDYQQIVNK